MAAKRERISPGRGGARFVRRDSQGKFKEVDAVGPSLKQDRTKKATNSVKSGQGDRGDRKAGRGSSRTSAATRKRSAPQKRGGGRKSGGGRTGTARHAARR